MRFWTFMAMAFGLTGTILTLLSIPVLIAAGAALFSGVAMGTGAAYLSRNTVTGTMDRAAFVDTEARVTVTIREGGIGKITFVTDEGKRELTARGLDKRTMEYGETVLITGVTDGVAEVTSLRPAENRREASAAQKAAAQKRQLG